MERTFLLQYSDTSLTREQLIAKLEKKLQQYVGVVILFKIQNVLYLCH